MLYQDRFSPSSITQDLNDRGLKSAKNADLPAHLPYYTPSFDVNVTSNHRGSQSPNHIIDGTSSPPYENHADTRILGTANYNTQELRLGATNFNNGPNKCRQLPCRTFICTGSCPYSERCVFLHPAEVIAKQVYVKIKRKSKEDTVADTFFWPTMPMSTVSAKLDSRNQPDIAQSYIIPAPGSYSAHNSVNDAAVFSMWEHFLDFLATDSLSVVTQPRAVPPLNPFQPTNRFTGKTRLSAFRNLSQGKHATALI
jgi:hypothetical protein